MAPLCPRGVALCSGLLWRASATSSAARRAWYCRPRFDPPDDRAPGRRSPRWSGSLPGSTCPRRGVYRCLLPDEHFTWMFQTAYCASAELSQQQIRIMSASVSPSSFYVRSQARCLPSGASQSREVERRWRRGACTVCQYSNPPGGSSRSRARSSRGRRWSANRLGGGVDHLWSSFRAHQVGRRSHRGPGPSNGSGRLRFRALGTFLASCPSRCPEACRSTAAARSPSVRFCGACSEEVGFRQITRSRSRPATTSRFDVDATPPST